MGDFAIHQEQDVVTSLNIISENEYKFVILRFAK